MVLILSGLKMLHVSTAVVGALGVVLAAAAAVMIVRGGRPDTDSGPDVDQPQLAPGPQP
jgi:hypothetical protein